jgi:decaprenylphospho-beta-D-ribofuranose 2-oxidase
MEQQSGWGNAITSKSLISSLGKYSENSRPRGSLAIGLRRSYGDSCLNSGGLILESSEMKNITLDRSTGVANCESGVTIGELESKALQMGFFPGVVPGTKHVSLGGAFASDIHGKSHHSWGAFSKDVMSIRIQLASGEVVEIGPEDERFWATAGGMGLTGAIHSLTIQLNRVESSYIYAENKRVQDLDSMMSELQKMNLMYPYTVAWIDLSGKFRGRGIVTGGRHAKASEVDGKYLNNNLHSKSSSTIHFPKIFPSGLINSLTVRSFNEIWYQKPLFNGLIKIEKFMHPLDGIESWNRVYGNKGFLQYQFVVPFEQSWFVKYVLEEMKKLNSGSFLGVLKSLGNESLGYLSFPKPGWTLTIDLPANTNGLQNVLNKLDEKLVEIGGRIYLSKDARMNSKHVLKMYAKLDEWREIRERMDPNHVWQSDQGRRLKLC